jgi:predicted dehydrogenase
MYNAAIIGVSGFGNIHYQDLKNGVESGTLKLVGATVINPDDEQEKCQWLKANGTKLYADWQAMLTELSGQIDICFIPTGIAMHVPMSIAALRAGANVFVEKPISATIQDARALAKVSEETGKFVAVGYQNIYQPDVRELKRALLAGKIGRVHCLKAKGFWPRNNHYYGRNNWAGKLKGNDTWILDSPINNALAHFLNLLCYFAGTEYEKSAELKEITAELYRANDIESTDTSCLKITTREDADILFYVTHASTKETHPYIEIHGEKGRVVFDLGSEHITITGNDGTTETIPITPHSAYRGHVMKALGEKLANPSAFVCTMQIAMAQTLCVNGAHESSAVHVIPADQKETIVEGDAFRVAVHGIEDILDRAFAEGKLLSELGIDWAVPGEPVSLTDYQEFKGSKIR